MTRREKILPWIQAKGIGLEIGPGPYPVMPKRDGFRVEVVDCVPRTDLVEKFKDHKTHGQEIEEVDHIWTGQTYAELTGRKKHYDWVVACHVIEHTPDLIAFLKDCETVLNEKGVLALVVPDKRHCFDYHRPLTGLARVVDSHVAGNRIHSVGTAAEYFMNVASRSNQISWESFSMGEFAHIHTLDETMRAMQAVRDEKAFLDIHAWCFVPNSFRLLMHDLYLLGYTGMRELAFYPTEGIEFTMLLSKAGSGPGISRMELSENILRECRESSWLKKQWQRAAFKLKKLLRRAG